jgi:hypothetical protein
LEAGVGSESLGAIDEKISIFSENGLYRVLLGLLPFLGRLPYTPQADGTALR